MNVSPVSFGSLMVFRFQKPGNQVPLHQEVGLSFPDEHGNGGNPKLQEYQFSAYHYKEKYDSTTWNANKNFAKRLDKQYRKQVGAFKSNPKRVIFTEVDAYVSPFKTEKKYFITAATDADEEKIHKILCESKRYYIAKWK